MSKSTEKETLRNLQLNDAKARLGIANPPSASCESLLIVGQTLGIACSKCQVALRRGVVPDKKSKER